MFDYWTDPVDHLLLLKSAVSNLTNPFRQWIIFNSPIGGSCTGNTNTPEKCLAPVIPACVDRNNYCTTPPAIPANAKREELFRPLEDWITFPDTKLRYYCSKSSWAFNYKTDPAAPSYYVTKNINNMTNTCNGNGYETFK